MPYRSTKPKYVTLKIITLATIASASWVPLIRTLIRKDKPWKIILASFLALGASIGGPGMISREVHHIDLKSKTDFNKNFYDKYHGNITSIGAIDLKLIHQQLFFTRNNQEFSGIFSLNPATHEITLSDVTTRDTGQQVDIGQWLDK